MMGPRLVAAAVIAASITMVGAVPGVSTAGEVPSAANTSLAQPTPNPSLDPSGGTPEEIGKPIMIMRQKSSQEVASEKAKSAAPSDSALTDARRRVLERDARRASGQEAVPKGPSTAAAQQAPPHNVVDCQGEDFARLDGGFVIDHYRWCEVTYWEVKTVVCSLATWLGCLRSKELAHAEFRRTTAGYGYDSTMYRPGDHVSSGLNQMFWVTLLDDWKNVRGAAAIQPLSLEILCDPRGPAECRRDPLSSHGVTKPIGEWMRDGGHYFRWLEEPADGLGPEKLTYFDIKTRQTYGLTEVNTTDGNSIRCDWATYLKGFRGCVYDRVESLFVLNIDGDTPYRKAALHIYDALFRPDRTVPFYALKAVPGSPWGRHNQRPLTRLYPDYGTIEKALYDANRREAVRACREHWGEDYSQGGQFDCDEFPMASTYEGAFAAYSNYSARVIDATDNGSAGGLLSHFYSDQRILHRDQFFVILTSRSGGGGGGEIPNRAPSANAGPDVTGNEGSPAVLGGSAYDPDGAPSVSWTYSPAPDVDPGATCTFTDPSRAATSIRCTDDGTFTVTVTANDGVNSPVSDSATVRLNNVSPALALAQATANTATQAAPGNDVGPDPWSVYRAGDTITVNAPFDDPGSNDSQTCIIDWDDSDQPDVFAAHNGRCDRTHVYRHAGMFTIKLTVTDDDTDRDISRTMVVVYDPDAGFVTAGGHIDSPDGALSSHPDVTGKLQFQFNPKYHHHDEGPAPSNGKVNAKFDGADFRLESTALEWLVIAPDGKAAAKGIGTLNGQEGYGFVVYGYDDPNGHRLVVWPLSAGPAPGESILYDNAKADFDIDQAEPQDLTGGSIEIHS